MTKKPVDTGMNRTGTAMSPFDSKKTAESSDVEVVEDPSIESIEDVRVRYSREADPVGTMPPPANIKGAVRTAGNALKGEKLTVFLDMMGERLAFERTGTRLYEALMAKLAAADDFPEGPTAADLKRLRDQEHAHFNMLVQALEGCGGDPTSMTPSADIASVASSGVLKVLTDPRTTLTEGLKAILVAELTDHDGWEALSECAVALGEDELATKFKKALNEEREHLANVRGWLKAAVGGQLGVQVQDRPADGLPASP